MTKPQIVAMQSNISSRIGLLLAALLAVGATARSPDQPTLTDTSKDSVKVVTFWGVNDGVSWRANGKPLLFDRNNQPKPAFDAVIRVATEAKLKLE